MKEWNVSVLITDLKQSLDDFHGIKKKALKKCMTSERFHVFHTVTHVQSCHLQNITTTLREASLHLSVTAKNPLLFFRTQRGRSPDFSDKPISSCCISPPLSGCHSAFSSLCVCDQSGAHHHSVAGWCGFSPQTSSQGVRALSCHVISRPFWRQRGRWQRRGRKVCNWANSCNPWVGCGLGFVKKRC